MKNIKSEPLYDEYVDVSEELNILPIQGEPLVIWCPGYHNRRRGILEETVYLEHVFFMVAKCVISSYR